MASRVGFYLAPGQPVERVLPLIARAALRQGQRLLVVADDAELLDRIGGALWDIAPAEFLANGRADGAHAAHQPVLLSQACAAENGAQVVALADGEWRDDAETFDRALLFFDEDGRAAARDVWRRFDGRDDIEREFHELEAGKWVRKR